MTDRFSERFEVDNVEEGGSGSFVLKADSVKDRFETDAERKGEGPGNAFRNYHGRKTEYVRVSARDVYENDALETALASDHCHEAADMIASIRIIKHEEGNPKCPHC